MSRADCKILGIMPLLVLCHLKKESFLFFGLWHELSVNASHICMRLFAILADGKFISNLISIRSLSVPLLSKYLPPMKLVLTPPPSQHTQHHHKIIRPFPHLNLIGHVFKDIQTKHGIQYVKPKHAHLVLYSQDSCTGSADSWWVQAVLEPVTGKQEVCCGPWLCTGKGPCQDWHQYFSECGAAILSLQGLTMTVSATRNV